MSYIDSAVSPLGARRMPNDIKIYGGIRIDISTNFGTGARIGDFRLPDFKGIEMFSKTEPLRSDEELKEAIAKIAKEDAEKGQFHNMTKEWMTLNKEYISSVSPDRESIVTNSMKQINSIKQTLKKANSPEEAKTMLDMLIMNMEKNNSNKVIDKAGNFGKLSIENNKFRYVEFYDDKGNMIATCDDVSGWTTMSTKAEEARMKEFFAIYNEAWRSTDAELKAQNKTAPKHLEGGTTIDAYA